MSHLWTTIDAGSQVWLANFWRASWQGALAIVFVSVLIHYCTFLSPRVSCWLWRLVCFKILLALLWTTPVVLRVLPAKPIVPAASTVAWTELKERPAGEAPNTAETAQPPVASALPRPAIASAFILIWAAGVAYGLVASLRQWSAVRRLMRSAEISACPLIDNELRTQASQLNVRRLPRLRISGQVHSPLLVGIVNPAIVLPRSACRADRHDLQLMLAHELAHQKRYDLVWNWMATVTSWLFFFHPLRWLFLRGWSESQEAACDELLIQRCTASAADYGRFLVRIAIGQVPDRTPLSAVGVLGAYHNLEQRINSMTRVRAASHRRLLLAAVVIFLVGVGTIVPWQLTTRTILAAEALSATSDAASNQEKLPGVIYATASWSVEATDGQTEHRQGMIAIDPTNGEFKSLGVDGYGCRLAPHGKQYLIQQQSKDQGADRRQVKSDAYVGELSGKEPRQQAIHVVRPVWSPDGKRIAYGVSNEQAGARGDVGFRGSSWSIDVTTQHKDKLGVPETDEVDDWTGNGNWLVTVSDRHPPFGSGYQLYRMHPDGGDELRLTEGGGLNCYPRFSPDGKRIVYIHQEKGVSTLWLVDTDGQNKRQILKEQGAKARPDGACWSPDGKWLAVRLMDWDLDDNGRKRIRPGTDLNYRIAILSPEGEKRSEIKLQGIKQTSFLGELDWH